MNITANQIAARPDAYGARTNTMATATACMHRCRDTNRNQRHRIINGCDGTYWIMPNSIAQILANAGYEIVA